MQFGSETYSACVKRDALIYACKIVFKKFKIDLMGGLKTVVKILERCITAVLALLKAFSHQPMVEMVQMETPMVLANYWGPSHQYWWHDATQGGPKARALHAEYRRKRALHQY